jgi:hypothetical protein
MGNLPNAKNLDTLQAGMGDSDSLFGCLFQDYQLVKDIFRMSKDGMKLAFL